MLENFRDGLAKTIRNIPKEDRGNFLDIMRENTTYKDAREEHIESIRTLRGESVEDDQKEPPLLFSVPESHRRVYGRKSAVSEEITRVAFENFNKPEVLQTREYIDRLKLLAQENEQGHGDWENYADKIGSVVKIGDLPLYTAEQLKQKLRLIRIVDEPWYKTREQKLGRHLNMPEIVEELHNHYPDLVLADIDTCRDIIMDLDKYVDESVMEKLIDERGVVLKEYSKTPQEEFEKRRILNAKQNGLLSLVFIYPGSVFFYDTGVWMQFNSCRENGVTLDGKISMTKINYPLGDCFMVMLEK